MQTIDSIESKYKLNAKDVYIKTLDLSQALAENKRLQDLEAKLEAERIKKEQEAEIKASKPVKNVIETTKNVIETTENVVKPQESVTASIPSVSEQVKEEPNTKAENNEDTKKYKSSFTVYGTKNQIMSLKQYMIDNSIEFDRTTKLN